MKDPSRAAIERAFERYDGLVLEVMGRVRRDFLPGNWQSLGIHPSERALYGERFGDLAELWFHATEPAIGGYSQVEGLTMVKDPDATFFLRDAIAEHGREILGEEYHRKHGRLAMFTKIYSFTVNIFLHWHLNQTLAEAVHQLSKEEGYYFAPELFPYGKKPFTYFGLKPSTTKEEVKAALAKRAWDAGDTSLLEKCHKIHLKPGTGWLLGSLLIHGPGAVPTIEPQVMADNLVVGIPKLENGTPVTRDLLFRDLTQEFKENVDLLVEKTLDWEENCVSEEEWIRRHYLEPVPAKGEQPPGVQDRWVVYGHFSKKFRNESFSSKELRLKPGTEHTVRDHGFTGAFVLAGSAVVSSDGHPDVHVSALPPFWRETEVHRYANALVWTADRARRGVRFRNIHPSQDFVLIRSIAGGSPDMPKAGAHRG
ncbi:MAG: hypothetical protein ACUVYA_16210 [Planctomycetota bacterium]